MAVVRKVVWKPNPGPQAMLFKCPADIILYGGAAGGGKGTRVTEPVATPYGFRAAGKVRVGDRICSPTHGNTDVIGVYPLGRRQLYRVRFSDGTHVDVTDDHIWLVWLASKGIDKRGLKHRLVTTKQLSEYLITGYYNVLIPLTEPVQFTRAYRPDWDVRAIEPYTLGVLLGDGCLSQASVSFCSQEEEVISRVARSYPVRGGSDPLRFGIVDGGKLGRELAKRGLRVRAEKKFIPEPYKWLCLEDRWSLIQGLMDTDGYIDDRGHVEFCSVSRRLSSDVAWVSRSLGFRVTESGARPSGYRDTRGMYVQAQDRFRLYIQGEHTDRLFHLGRKRGRACDFNGSGKPVGRRVESVEAVDKDEAVCIKVDNPNGLYIVGNSFIVTHNTDAAILWAQQYCNRAGYKAVIFRKTFPELERHIIERSRALFSGIGHYDVKNHRWRFKTPASPGATISVGGEAVLEFAHLERDADLDKYQGAEYARIAFDESTQFTEQQIRFMLTRLRSPVEGIPRQMLLTANPVGPGYQYHKLMFVGTHSEPRKTYKIYKDALWPSDGKPVGLSTCFIPARVWDNPILLARDPQYPQKLQTQYGAVTNALLYGSWDEAINLALEVDPSVHYAELSQLYPSGFPAWSKRWIGIDYGKADKASAVWLNWDGRQLTAYRDYSRRGKDIIPFAHEVVSLSKQDLDEHGNGGASFAVLSHECFADRGQGVKQADLFAGVFRMAGISLMPSDRDPEGRLVLIREYLRTTPIKYEGNRPLEDTEYWLERMRREGSKAGEEYLRIRGIGVEGSASMPLPKLKIIRPTKDGRFGCPDLIKNLPLLVVRQDAPFKLAGNQDDHSYDAAGHALKAFVGGVTIPAEHFYGQILDGKMPESGFQAQLAMDEARRRSEQNDIPGSVAWPSKYSHGRQK